MQAFLFVVDFVGAVVAVSSEEDVKQAPGMSSCSAAWKRHPSDSKTS